MEIQPVLDDSVRLFQEELADNLAGVYLHGSLAMGSFHPVQSDIDLLIVVYHPLSPDVLKRLARRVVLLHESIPTPRGIELSIVLSRYLREFEHPAPFEFHFSDGHLARYKEDENYICGGFGDADLAAHFTVVYHRGIALYGAEPKEAFSPVNKGWYVQSIVSDIENAEEEIVKQPVYYTLNLCRVLGFLRDGVVLSKQEGGVWGLNTLPELYHELVKYALDRYAGNDAGRTVDEEELTGFARYMLGEIHQAMAQAVEG